MSLRNIKMAIKEGSKIKGNVFILIESDFIFIDYFIAYAACILHELESSVNCMSFLRLRKFRFFRRLNAKFLGDADESN